ncbi:MAG TPA: phosphoribosylformylglycinamidine synthase subunit PurS [Hanamia sp.]|jgi:phosphoribosylformylglycinamidine synthase subunit PurS|nr:phosphoribosylformylglycinamidine synthase subunit PurS [Hanamia sp.]
MNFVAEIKIMPLKELLDPQGKAVMGALSNLGIKSINDVRIGKHIQLTIEAASAEEAKSIAQEAAEKLLANPVMEEYFISIHLMSAN